MNTLLVIGYVWPEPRSSAAGSRMLQLLELFRDKGWDITFASPAQHSEHAVDLAAMGIKATEIALNCSSFDEMVKELQPQVVLFDRFMMEEQFGWRVEKHCPDALRLLDTEDLHSLRHARHTALKQQRELQPQDLNSELAQREIAAIYRCDLTLMISEAEMDLLQQHYGVPAHILRYCPFMLEPNQQQLPGFQQRQHFISIGNFRHEPNWNAVLWLKQEIWPQIRKALPGAELHIYGAYPPPKATQLHNPRQGFLVKGWADDAHEVMRSARVCLAPLRFGAGLKGKLADAMQCGTPNITTDIGAEGMAGALPWPGFIANNAEAIAQAAVALYNDESRWQHMQQQGFDIIEQRFNGDTTRQELWQSIEHCRAQLHQHRQSNFTGLMLRHHHHKSTQYMAQWIEAKNKNKT